MQRNKVLLIEDEYSIAETIKVSLELEGYEVIVAPDGETGLASALVNEPDIILLDIMLPDMDGWEILRQFKSASPTKFIPVIVITGLGKTDHILKGFEIGADDYIQKPIDSNELFARIKNLLSRLESSMPVDPLTRIPGKAQVYDETRRRIQKRSRFFAFMYFDISNLRVVNEKYGIEVGNELIRALAEILCDVTIESEEFAGYIGEDDFVVLTVPVRVSQIFQEVTSRFDTVLGKLCPEIATQQRRKQGKTVRIASAVVTNEHRQFGDPLQVKNIALEILGRARNMKDHCCLNLKNFPV